MARMNNQVRSLQIIARQNGWDPNKLMGDLHAYREDRVERGDSGYPQELNKSAPNNGGDTPATIQDDPPLKSHKTTNADPYGGMGNF